MTDLLLYNGFTPLRRSPADLFLDNGIGMLTAALRQAGVDFSVVDPVCMDEMRRFDLPKVQRPLRALFKQSLFSDEPLSQAQQERLDALLGALHRHQDTLMDEHLDRVVDQVVRQQVGVVGIKLWAGSTFRYCVDLCERIHHRSPHTVVVAGGPQVNCYAHEGKILELSPFDLAVYSEGESALCEIVRLARGRLTRQERINRVVAGRVPNLIYRDGMTVRVNPVATCSLSEKPNPVYDTMAGRIPVHTVVDALGCDYGKCHFCIHPSIYPGFRKRRPTEVVDEIEQMVRQGIGLFSFTASDTPLGHAVQLSEEILRRGLNIEYTMLTRAKRNARKKQDRLVSQFRVLLRAGLKSVFFGVESGNDLVLSEVMNKGVCVDDIAVTAACLRRASELEQRPVNIIASFIYPVPLPPTLMAQGVTEERVLEDNLELLEQMAPDSFHAAPGLLYAGTAWSDEPERFGIEYDNQNFWKKWIVQEFSYHGFVEHDRTELYRFNGKPLESLVQAALGFARRGNQLGHPSDLWEEHFIFARAGNISGEAALAQLSMDLFLDLLVCNDEQTVHLYDAVSAHSRQVASSNIHLFNQSQKGVCHGN